MAWLIGVQPVTIRQWAFRGLIQRSGEDGRGRTLYDVDHVLEFAATRGYAPVGVMA